MNKQPTSTQDLVNAFKNIGIKESMNLMVHSSLSSIGWVIGGANSVITALFEVIGKNGTLVMSAATPMCLHPEDWDEKINADWIPKIVEHLPVFDLHTTPTTMGAISEAFRTWPSTLRSNHPISSVCANGLLAESIVNEHQLKLSEGINTPYEKIYTNSFYMLLLGVGFNRCTMLHFAESKSKNPRFTKSRYQIINAKSARKEWVEVLDMANDNSTYFPKVGEAFLTLDKVKMGKIGHAKSMLFSANYLVDFAITYFDKLDK